MFLRSGAENSVPPACIELCHFFWQQTRRRLHLPAHHGIHTPHLAQLLQA